MTDTITNLRVPLKFCLSPKVLVLLRHALQRPVRDHSFSTTAKSSEKFTPTKNLKYHKEAWKQTFKLIFISEMHVVRRVKLNLVLSWFNAFLANVSILNPLKTPEKQSFFRVFRGYKMETLARKGSKLKFMLIFPNGFYCLTHLTSKLSSCRNQSICIANQLTGFYMIASLAFNELTQKWYFSILRVIPIRIH